MITLTPYVDAYFGTEKEISVVPALFFPFKNNPIPDIYARVEQREYQGVPGVAASPASRMANRTSFTNLLTWSGTFSNGVWVPFKDGTGVMPVLTSGFTGPDGQNAYRLQLDRGAGTTSGDNSGIQQTSTLAGLPNPHAACASIFVKSNTGSPQVAQLYSANGNAASLINITTEWQRFVVADATSLTTDVIRLWTVGSLATTAALDILIAYGQFEIAAAAGPCIPTTSVARTISSPDQDTTVNPSPALRDIFAYLAEETDPVFQTSTSANIKRKFARIPSAQTIPGSINLSKPSLAGTFPQVYGAYRLFQPDITLLKYDAYASQTVMSDTGAPAVYPTGGTYTITFAGQTTGAIAYNASNATVQTALNALSTVSDRGNAVVTGSYNSGGGFTVTFNDYAASTTNLASLTGPSSYSTGVNMPDGGYSQTWTFSALAAAIWTGGTFTITIFGQTTGAIAYNASAATVAAALNALSEVQTKRGGVAVTIPADQTTILSTDATRIIFTFSFANAVMTSSAASLTPTGSTITQAIVGTSGKTQTVVFLAGSTAIRSLLVPGGHGLSLTDTLYIKGGSTYYAGIAPGAFTLPDAYTISLNINGAQAYVSASTITEVGRRTKQNYAPGSAMIPCNKTTTFYLPGVSPGVATAADIPIPASQSDPGVLLSAIFAGTGMINYVVGERAQWMGPILSQDVTTILAQDV